MKGHTEGHRKGHTEEHTTEYIKKAIHTKEDIYTYGRYTHMEGTYKWE